MPKPSDPGRFIVEVTPPTVAEQSDTPDTPRLRKVPGKVNDDGLEYIRDAISLKRATLASVMPGISDGVALTLICRDWLRAESARLSGKGGD